MSGKVVGMLISIKDSESVKAREDDGQTIGTLDGDVMASNTSIQGRGWRIRKSKTTGRKGKSVMLLTSV